MTFSAWAQGWTGLAGTKLSEAGRTLVARSALAATDLTGTHGILPDRVLHAPLDPRLPDPERAAGLVQGLYAFESGTEALPAGTSPWRREGPGPFWRQDLFGFDWMRHLAALEPRQATDRARWLVNTWIHDCGTWHPVAWRADILAMRLTAWFTHHRMILEAADLIWRSAFLRSLIRQANHLHQNALLAPAGEPRLQAAIGLALTGLCLPHGEKRLSRGLALILDALQHQILPDGGHVSRNPEVLARLYLALARLDHTLAARRRERPEDLQRALDRMAPMLRFFCHGDGVPAAFHGAHRLSAEDMTAILGGDDTGGLPMQRATQSGFHRIERGRAVLIVDTGYPPAVDPVGCHAGCLSFELSTDAERIIVNCGASRAQGETWRQALRATAAHSTVTVADTSSCRFMVAAPPKRRRGKGSGKQSTGTFPSGDGRLISGPKSVSVERADQEEGTLIDAAHDGYNESFGVMHRRRLYMDGTGTDIRGEDRLSLRQGKRGNTRGRPLGFAARFHLHPDVIPELTGSGDRVQLTLQNGQTWRFQAAGGTLGLEESAYLDEAGTVCQSRQIVVRGVIGARGAVVKWAVSAAAPMASRAAIRARLRDEERPEETSPVEKAPTDGTFGRPSHSEPVHSFASGFDDDETVPWDDDGPQDRSSPLPGAPRRFSDIQPRASVVDQESA